METTECLLQRIETVDEVRSLTKTMKTLAAVNMKQCEAAADPLFRFEETNALALLALRSAWPSFNAAATRERRSFGIVFGPERGLCGKHAERLAAQTPEFDILIIVGRRLLRAFEAQDRSADSALAAPSSTHGIGHLTEAVKNAANSLGAFEHDTQIQLVHMARNEMGGLAYAEKTAWPLDFEVLSALATPKWPGRRLAGPYGDATAGLNATLRQRLDISLRKACLAAMAAESAARLAVMQAAEENIKKRLADLQQEFRLRRQRAITDELMDIRAGYDLSAGGFSRLA